MRADAGILSMLARAAQIESVHCTIVDKFSGLTPHVAYSNSSFFRREEEKQRNAVAELADIIEREAAVYECNRDKAIVDADNAERARYATAA